MPVLRTCWSSSAGPCARANVWTSKAGEALTCRGLDAEGAAGPAGTAPARGTGHPRTPLRLVLPAVDGGLRPPLPPAPALEHDRVMDEPRLRLHRPAGRRFVSTR